MQLSKKLKAACAYLSSERVGDCHPDQFVDAIQAGLITPEQIYSVMEGLHAKWIASRAEWLQDVTPKTRRLLESLISKAHDFDGKDYSGQEAY